MHGAPLLGGSEKAEPTFPASSINNIYPMRRVKRGQPGPHAFLGERLAPLEPNEDSIRDDRERFVVKAGFHTVSGQRVLDCVGHSVGPCGKASCVLSCLWALSGIGDKGDETKR
jgi:hypothetical protein